MTNDDAPLDRALAALKRERYDESAWASLYDTVVRRARVAAFRLVQGDAARADDVVHDALLRVLHAADFSRFSEGEDFLRYFYTVVRHAALDAMRARPREVSLEDVGNAPAARAEAGISWVENVPDERPGPEAQLAAKQALERLHGLLGRRELVVCELLAQGYGTREIAGRLGVSDGAAAVAVHRLRSRLLGNT